MTLLQLLLMLGVGAAIIYGVMKAIAGDWKAVFIMIAILVIIIWILGVLGITLPTLGPIK